MRAASSAGLRPLYLAAVIGLALVASVATVASAAPTLRPTNQLPNNAPAASFVIFDAVVVSSPLLVGSACPAPTTANHSAIPGATGQTVAICGRNLANAPRTPVAAHSSLGGTFIASHGAFTSARIGANSANVVLGNWANVTISSSSPGPGKTVLAKVGSNPAQTSPLTMLSGYSTNEAPVAAAASATTNEDTASGPITLSASDPNGDPMTFSIASGPAHGTLGAISPAACPSTAPAAHTCTATVVYTPALNYNGPDSFTFIATDSIGAASAPATVSLTVTSVNDAPVVNPATFTIFENRPNGTAVGTVTSSDVDTGQTRTYSIQAGNTGGAFAIDASTGAITVANSGALNYETTPAFSLTVRATDNGSPALFGEATVTVNLTDINDAPTLDPIANPAAILEDAGEQNELLAGISAGDGETQVLTVTATSDNTALIPNPTVTYASPNATGSLAYAPVADQSGSAVITVTVIDNGGTANGGDNDFSRTFTVAVTAVNDAPTLDPIANPAAILEDAGEQTVNLAGIGAGPGDGAQTLVVSATSDNTALVPNPTVTYTSPNNTGSLAYTPVANQSGSAVITVTVADNGGTANGGVNTLSRTFTVTVTPVNDAPTLDAISNETIQEDIGPQTVGLAGISAGGGESQTLTVTATSDDPALVPNPTVTYTSPNATGSLAYTPAVNQNGSATITVTVTDNGDTANGGDIDFSRTFTITVSPVNDPPTLTTTASALAYTEGDGPVAIDSGLTLADPESDQISGATVQITAGFTAAQDELAVAPQNGITGVYDEILGNLTLTGTTSIANYQTALRSVTYTNSATPPSTAMRTVSFQATDNGTPNQASNTGTRNITVATLNQAPVVTTTGGDTAYTENAAAVAIDGALTVTDADDTNIESGVVRISSGFESGDGLLFTNTIAISGSYDTGTGVLTLTGADTVANYQAALRSIQYRNLTDDTPTLSKTVEFKVSDGSADSNAATKGIAVTAVNDAPALTTTGSDRAYTEGDGAVAIDVGLTATDPDNANLAGATVSITSNFVSADDDLAFTNQNGITGAYNDSTGVLTLSGSASVANYQTALRSVAYTNSSENPSGSKTVSFQVTDSDSGPSNVATREIDLTAVNDAPVVATSGGDTAYTENAAGVVVDGTFTVSDVDDINIESGVVRLSVGFEAGDDLLFTNQAGISGSYDTGTGVLTLTGSASKANYQTALRSIQYRNLTDDTPTLSKTVEFKVNDGDVDSNAATKGIAVTAVNDGPVVGNKAHAVTGNVDISVPAGSGLLIGVTDPEGNGGFVASIDASSAHLGNAVVNGDGSYMFNPKPGRQGLDTVVFKVCDDGTPSACSTANLALTVADMIWFVDNSEGSTGDGRIASPFNTLGDLAGINDGLDTATTFHPAAGDTIFVYRDSATDYTGGLTLLASQKLVGAGATASLSTISGITLAADSVAVLPPTGGTRPNVVGGLVLGSGNTVRGLNLGDATTSLSGTGFGTLTLGIGLNADLAISTNGRAINLTTGTVSGDLISVTSTGGANNVLLTNVASTGTSLGSGALSGATGDSFAISSGTGSFTYSGSITGSAANSVDISSKTGGTVTLSGSISDTGAGIRLASNAGATIALSGGVTVSSGVNAAFTAIGGGTVSVTGASNTLATTTGTALNVANTTIGASGLTFRSVSANGAASGIVLNATGASGGLTVTGTGTANSGGTIQNSTSHGISLTSTQDVSLTSMNIQSAVGSGIFGTGVTDFSFVDGTIDNSGTGGVAQTSNIAFNNQTGTENNLSGTVTITGNTLTNARYHGISIFNFAGTISDLNVSNNTLQSSALTASSLGGGIQVVAFGSASAVASITNATINNNVINNFPSGVGLQVQCGNANSAAAPSSTCGSGGANVIAITNNKINVPGLGSTIKTGAEGIIALVNGVGLGNFNISSNNVQQNLGTSISSSAFGNANLTETISGNTVVANNTVASQGIGVGTSNTGGFATNSPQLTATITGNTVSLTDGNGILAVARDSSAGQLDVSIKNNFVAAPLTGVRPGIRIDAGNASGDNDVCLDISGNTSAGSGLSPGIGLRKQGTSPTVNAFGVEGMAATATPAVEAFVNGQNLTGGGTILISATSGFSNCSSAP